MKIGELVVYKNLIYEIVDIDWPSLANRFKLSPVASFTTDDLDKLLQGKVYISNSESIELFTGIPPKHRLGERVKYNSYYYTVRFVLAKDNTYEYQLIREEKSLSFDWASESELY